MNAIDCLGLYTIAYLNPNHKTLTLKLKMHAICVKKSYFATAPVRISAFGCCCVQELYIIGVQVLPKHAANERPYLLLHMRHFVQKYDVSMLRSLEVVDGRKKNCANSCFFTEALLSSCAVECASGTVSNEYAY